MKALFILLLILTVNLSPRAQQSSPSYFAFDTLPAEGYVLLNKGWKFQPGDNFNWARPSFNDSSWQQIDPTKNIYYLPS